MAKAKSSSVLIIVACVLVIAALIWYTGYPLGQKERLTNYSASANESARAGPTQNNRCSSERTCAPCKMGALRPVNIPSCIPYRDISEGGGGSAIGIRQ